MAAGTTPKSEEQARAPLGPSRLAAGFRFRLFSAHAEGVELCFFDRPESVEANRRVPLARGTDGIWQADVEDAELGDCYGYRVAGPWEPERGYFFDAARLLLDPWARAVAGELSHDKAIYPHDEKGRRDSAGAMPKAVLVDESFDRQGVASPRIPWQDTVIYEAHVRGLTRQHPEVPEKLRGTYLGLSHPAMLRHFERLGVTTLELMPICQFGSERHLLARGMRNYWGYSPLALYAPHAGYATAATGAQLLEVKTMVRELHRAGLEVLVDVVANHTVEGGAIGSILSLKGIDAPSFYRLDDADPDLFVDWTGCGNTLDVRQPATRELVLGALHYWAKEIGVDGFRLDLAPILARDPGAAFEAQAPFFAAIAADPALARLKWIAEPWDLGPGGYRLGAFPAGWAEWNDRFRNTTRRFWRGEGHLEVAADLARRLAGSHDCFGARAPLASVNYLSAHDGFTLVDLNTYTQKHNLANGEENRDGTDANFSSNWGVEGPTEQPVVSADRRRAIANQLATWALAAGVPMLGHGDELGRSQRGNNNAYCQDNETAWVDWASFDHGRFDNVRWLLQVRRHWNVLRSVRSWRGFGDEAGDPLAPRAAFFGADGRACALEEWTGRAEAAFGMWLDPADSREEGMLALFNGGLAPVNLVFPDTLLERRLTLLLYSAWPRTPRSSAIGLSNWTLDRLTTVIFAVGPVLTFEAGSGWP